LVRRYLPESARWLAQQGRQQEAHQVLSTMEQRCGLPAGPAVQPDDAAGQLPKRGRCSERWSPANRNRTQILVVMNS
ncbi:MFS transporter, partial [Pantoea eucalypti]